MSYYLCFRKGGVKIFNTCRVTKLYSAFVNAPFDEWKPMEKQVFETARYTLEMKEDHIKDQIDTYNRMFESSKEWDERWDTLTAIKEFEDELKEIKNAKIQLDMLENIFNEGEYAETAEEKATFGLEWGIF